MRDRSDLKIKEFVEEESRQQFNEERNRRREDAKRQILKVQEEIERRSISEGRRHCPTEWMISLP